MENLSKSIVINDEMKGDEKSQGSDMSSRIKILKIES
jgi:hypothetical protein